MSSAVTVTPLGSIFFAAMNARMALFSADFRPFSCVPPCGVGMPFA
jgi:hypothetical protein